MVITEDSWAGDKWEIRVEFTANIDIKSRIFFIHWPSLICRGQMAQAAPGKSVSWAGRE